MLESLFLWLDADRFRFFGAVWLTFAVCAGLALSRLRWARWWNSAPVFAAALFVALFAHRWTVALDPQRHGNPDETQIISDALAYAYDPVPFRSVDGNTSGPLTPYTIIAFARLLDRPIDLIAARLLGVTCLFVALVATWRTLANFAPEARARLLTLPALPVIGGAYNFDLMQFNNEHLPVALLAGAIWALAPLLDTDRRVSLRRLALAALLIGISPLAKPQVAPMTLWLAGTGLVLLWKHPALRPRRRLAVSLYASGGVLPAVALFGTCALAGSWPDMWASFITNNLHYTGHRQFAWSECHHALLRLVRESTTVEPVFWPAAGGALLCLLAAPWLPAASAARRLALLAGGFFVAALVALLAPGKIFFHYTLLLLHPAILVLGALFSLALDRVPRPAGAADASSGSRWPARLAVAAIWAVWVGGVLAPSPWRHATFLPLRYGHFGERDLVEPNLVAALRRFTQPGEPLAVWGWAPWIYVWAQQPHASREGVTQRQIDSWGDYGYYRRRFADDIARTRPVVFLDATGPHDFGFRDPLQYQHEKFYEVQRRIGLDYQYVETVEDVRLFVRRDRLPPEALAPPDPIARGLTRAHPAPDRFAGMPPSNMNLGPLGLVTHAHAPCLLIWEPVPERRHARFSFGIDAGAWTDGRATDGVAFNVFIVHPDGREEVLFTRFLDPLARPADRGVQAGEVAVPAGVRLTFETAIGPASNNNFDWSFWREITLEPAPSAAPVRVEASTVGLESHDRGTTDGAANAGAACATAVRPARVSGGKLRPNGRLHRTHTRRGVENPPRRSGPRRVGCAAPPMLHAAFFDFDGLLLDTESCGFAALRELFAARGADYSLADYGRIVGTHNNVQDLVDLLVARSGRPCTLAEFEDEREAREIARHAGLAPRAGVVELLAGARARGWKLAVVSSSSHAWVDPKVAAHGLAPFFDTIVCRGDAARAKPAPDLYLEALRRAGVAPGEAVAFEDSFNGSLAAKRAGLWCVAAPGPVTDWQDFSHCDRRVASLAAVSADELAVAFGPGSPRPLVEPARRET